MVMLFFQPKALEGPQVQLSPLPEQQGNGSVRTINLQQQTSNPWISLRNVKNSLAEHRRESLIPRWM